MVSELDNTPIGIYLLKFNNRKSRTKCEICSKLTMKTPERRGCGGGLRKPFINYFPDNKYLQKDRDDPYSDFQPF